MTGARRALLIGIDAYDNLADEYQLHGCVADADAMELLLQRHEDGSPNYDTLKMTTANARITRADVRRASQDLFKASDHDVLLYFSGHGMISDAGGVIVTQDSESYDEGITMDEMVALASKSLAQEVVMIFDCCYSGHLGQPALMQTSGTFANALLRENTTILAAAREFAQETAGHGIYTSLLLEALRGGAADLLGNVAAPSIHLYTDRSFGGWDQRPVYKSHSSAITPIRKCKPLVDPALLRQLPTYFASPDSEIQLSPAHEYDQIAVTPEQLLGQLLKKFRDAGLVVCPSGEDLYWVSHHNGTVALTQLGRHYWNLARRKRI